MSIDEQELRAEVKRLRAIIARIHTVTNLAQAEPMKRTVDTVVPGPEGLHPVEMLRRLAVDWAEDRGLEVDHASFDSWKQSIEWAAFACEQCGGSVDVSITATGMPATVRVAGVKCSSCPQTYTVEIKRGSDA